jgi:hypothetical protein
MPLGQRVEIAHERPDFIDRRIDYRADVHLHYLNLPLRFGVVHCWTLNEFMTYPTSTPSNRKASAVIA